MCVRKHNSSRAHSAIALSIHTVNKVIYLFSLFLLILCILFFLPIFHCSRAQKLHSAAGRIRLWNVVETIRLGEWFAVETIGRCASIVSQVSFNYNTSRQCASFHNFSSPCVSFSFVQELVALPLDGVTILLETLRSIQLSQQSNSPTPTAQFAQVYHRRALIDELACL